MTRAWGKSGRNPGRRGPSTAVVSSRTEWRRLIALARQCAADAREQARGDDAQLRLMALCRRSGSASVAVLDRDAGAAVADCARAFLKVAAALSRASTPAVTREGLAPVVEASAEFLDDQLHALNAAEFQRAHEGRPEVWG